MSASRFIDTNVFVYHVDFSDGRKQAVADALVREALTASSASTSFQVVQEWLNTVTRKALVPLSSRGASDYLDTVLAPLCKVWPNMLLYHRAVDLQLRWQFSFYDALIVAAALTSGCKTLLSEDLQHGQRVESLVIENPFL